MCIVVTTFSISVVNCGTLTDPPNGMVTLTNTTFGGTATYSCNTGYTLSGDMTRMCGADGNWTGSEPNCVGECLHVLKYTLSREQPLSWCLVQ